MTIPSKKGCLGSAAMGKLNFCEHCVVGKQKRVNFATTKHRMQGIIHYIHFDLWGPVRVPSFGGKRYMLTFC